MISQSALLEVNLKNIIFNYKYLSSLNKNHYTGATIKANAYGLGDKEIIKTLYKAGCRYFFVATLDEAIKLIQTFKYGFLYVLNGVKKKDFNKYLIENTTSIFNIPKPNTNKKLLKTRDVLGRETKETNQLLFYIYDDGTVEKRIILE